MYPKKQIFKLNCLKKLLTDDNSCVSVVSTTRLLALPPFFLNDMKSGILFLLNAMLKKYDRSLGGIVIGYQNIKILMDENTGIIPIGTFETEVNISVDFYIFQPKIGSYLEGVINKKSNNHIGCLVHRYFNATILKPEDIDYDDWICKDFSVDDKVIFKVKDLDFTTLVPYIEGTIDPELHTSSVKKTGKSGNYNVNNLMNNDLDKTTDDELSYSTNLFENKSSKKYSQNDSSSSAKSKSRNEEEVSILEHSLNTSSEEYKSFSSPKKKKKKKKEKSVLDFEPQSVGEGKKNSVHKEVTSDNCNNQTKAEDNLVKKSKKKKSKHHDKSDNQEGSTAAENAVETPVSSFLEKYLEIEDINPSDFVEETKSKKVKKRKKEKEKNVLNLEDLNKSEGPFGIDLLHHEKNSVWKEIGSDSCGNESKTEDGLFSKEKKKKKRKHQENSDIQESITAAGDARKFQAETPVSSFLEKRLLVEDEDLNDFVIKTKSKKVKKRKKDNDEPLSDLNKTNMCLPVEPEDDLLCSTQLESISEPKKMKLPFFSPITVNSDFEEKNIKIGKQNLNFSLQLNNRNESQEKEKERGREKQKEKKKEREKEKEEKKEKKNKHKKRKREEKDESEGCSAPKQMKTSHTTTEKAAQIKTNCIDVKSEIQIMMEEMCKKLLNEAKEQLNVSDEVAYNNSKLKKKKKESKKKEKKATRKESLKVNKGTLNEVNGLEEKSDVESILDKLLEDEMKRLEEDLSKSSAHRVKSS